MVLILFILTGCDRSEKTDHAPDSERAAVSSGSLVARPFPALSASVGEDATDGLFERLPGAGTGVDFVNPIDTSHPMKYLYASSMGCGGVAVGDIDGDGRPDLYFTGGPRANALYRQVSDLKFKDVTASAGVDGGGAWSTGASIVDIDDDGDLDIYVCNYDSPNLLYINTGDGGFVERAKEFGIDFVGAGHTPAFCDFDLDGDLDLYLMTNFFYNPGGKVAGPVAGMRDGKPQIVPQFEKYYAITGVDRGARPGEIRVSHDSVGQSDRFVRNDGATGAGGQVRFSEMTRPGQIVGKGNAAIWWDEDGDGYPDLYVANDFKDPDWLFHNNGDGGFGEIIKKRVPHTTWFSMGADSADLDGDGRPDLMVADMSGTNHLKQKLGMGAMSDSAEFLSTAVPRQYMRNTVFLNPGGGRFLEAAHLTGLANSDWTWTVRLSDFDNDGWVDVFLTNGMAVNLNVSDNPDAVSARPGETEWDKHERAGTGPLKEQNLAFRNHGDLEFEDVSKSWGLDHVGMSYAATAADLDRDGDLEIIVANLEEPVAIYQNHSQGSNRLIVELRGGQGCNQRGLGATVRVETGAGVQTRFLTLNRGYMAAGEAVLHFGLGDEPRIDRLSVRWPGGGEQVFEDVAANQHLTITQGGEAAVPANPVAAPMFSPAGSNLAEVVHRETPFDDYARQPLLPHKLSQLGPGIAVGDIDADGDEDVFVGGARGDVGKLMRNSGQEKFEAIDCPAILADRESEDMGAVFFDCDGDGDLDLYVVSGGVECEPGDAVLRDRLYLNDGDGTFAAGARSESSASGSVVAACDFDADGDLDLFVGGRVIPGRYPLAAKSSLLRNSGGQLVDVTDELAPELRSAGMVTGALWSDVDGDGSTDLLVTYEWGPVRLFRNRGGHLEDQTEASGLASLSGWWNGIAGADIDHDGDIDYAVTNVGLNTKYHASPARPALLYYGDFQGDGRMRLVEAEFENETLYPVRGRSCSSGAMPFILDKFDSYKGFALASVEEIYTPDKLATSHRFAATELRSGILLNDGSGRFTFQALARIAQIAPGFGASFCDFDFDGHADLYVVQNFFSPQPETGRMAGGVSQLLKGAGDGGFTAVSPQVSGLVVPGDAKSLAKIDLGGDGWAGFLIGVNNGELIAMRNDVGGDRLSVGLAGRTGNPTGIGARIAVNANGLPEQLAEVYAGSGYLSQDSPRLQFAGSNQATQIEVRWPDGKVSVLDMVEGTGTIAIKYPEN